jgi:hypothetical protein
MNFFVGKTCYLVGKKSPNQNGWWNYLEIFQKGCHVSMQKVMKSGEMWMWIN